MPIKMILRKNGTRQPQVANSSPDDALTPRITKFDRNRPEGTGYARVNGLRLKSLSTAAE
jgi:hypothetical protein